MRTFSRILVAVAIGALAVPAVAGAAQAPRKAHGIVVQRDAKAGVVVIASKSGALQRIHVASPGKLAMGTVLQVVGTKVAVVGHVHRAKLRGTVVRRHRHSFALAGNGSVLAVTSPTPPAAGNQVTATVQVTPTELDDDNGDEQINQNGVGSAELRGTVGSVSDTLLTLVVPGAVAGSMDSFPITLTTPLVPPPAQGMQVEVRVTLSAPGGILALTLVSIRVEGQNNNNGGEQHGNFVKAEGQVVGTPLEATATTPGSITVAGEHGTVTFIIPAGFPPTGVTAGAEVEAKGTLVNPTDTQPTLVRLEVKGGNNAPANGGNDQSGDGENSGQSSGGND